MKKLALTLGFLLLVGCESVQTPPKRPVAYMFPTVRTVQSTQSLTPQHCTKDRLIWALNTAGVGPALQRSGMLDMDYDVIVRGLSQRGFAEVDARRAVNTPFRWLTFSFLQSGRLEIMACFRSRRGFHHAGHEAFSCPAAGDGGRMPPVQHSCRGRPY